VSKFSSLCLAAGLLCSAAILLPASAANRGADEGSIPNFNPDGDTAWAADRPASDDFLPHDKSTGPGPVESDPKHPYTPNGQGQPTYRIADLTNPILKPWVIEQMKKTNDDVLAGKVPFIARERCYPGGVPNFDIYNRGQPVHIIQTKDKVWMINELYASTRRIYLNVPHSKNPKPSWYGESVGRYEGDTLVVDTIGLAAKGPVDNWRTPHSDQLHVVERFRIIDGGKTLEVRITMEDPVMFTQLWTVMQKYHREEEEPLSESICAENNVNFFNEDVTPIPTAAKADF